MDKEEQGLILEERGGENSREGRGSAVGKTGKRDVQLTPALTFSRDFMKFVVRVKCCYSYYIIIKEKAS